MGILFIFIFFSVPLFWFIREIKAINFWLYLWQMKEYHTGRFFDHFRTTKGKQLLFNNLFFLKIVIFCIVLIIAPFLVQIFDPEDLYELHLLWGFSLLLLFFSLYTGEAVRAIRDSLRKRLLLPTPTKKIVILRLILVSGTILFVFSPSLFVIFSLPFPLDFNPYAAFLLYDILTPIIVSAVVLGFQPFTVLARNRMIRRAKEKRAKFKNLKVIGITGSYGKTSTKEFLAHILGQKFHVLKTPEHQNSEVGVSNTILRSLTSEHDVFVCEMGAYNKGGIKLLADTAKPQIGIVTGVNEQHLATFGSMENLLSAEGGGELVDSFPKDGVIILNGNNRYCRELYEKIEKPKKVLCNTFGAAAPNVLSLEADIKAENIKIEKENISFEVDGKKFRVQVCGGHNVQNLLLAIAAAKEIGMSLEEIAKACETITPDLGALKVKTGINGVTIIDSTYSANPDGVIADLDYLSLYEGKKILIMPCLIELGKASKDVHRRIGEKIGEVCDRAIIVTKDWFREIKNGAIPKGMKEENILYRENPQEILDTIKTFCKEGNVVLLEGRLPRAIVSLLE